MDLVDGFNLGVAWEFISFPLITANLNSGSHSDRLLQPYLKFGKQPTKQGPEKSIFQEKILFLNNGQQVFSIYSKIHLRFYLALSK